MKFVRRQVGANMFQEEVEILRRGGEGEVGEGMGGEILGLGTLDVPLRVTGMCVWTCTCVRGTTARSAYASMRA